MTEFTFFAGKEDRWGDNMMAVWGKLDICPYLDCLELPCHTSEELLSISHLKVWGDTQEPHRNMAYLLVHTKSYGLTLVWISPLQIWASMMEEVIRTLSACISSGPDWPYVLAQLYKGSNHTPLPKDKHLGILPKEKAEESLHGWISQLEVHQLLSAGSRIIYLVGLNGLNQPVTIDLPELLHSSSSNTTDEHPLLRIDITLPPSEDPECTSLSLGGAHAIPTATTPRTPWKPRISLMAEVDDLLKWGIMDDYNHESEHSAMGKEAATDTDVSLSHRVEVPALPINTSSQASMEEGEASPESNPLNVSPTADTYSSCSESPMVDLMELQGNANLAADHLLSIKRSTDLQREWIRWELGLQLHQNEAKEAAANEEVKVLHLCRVLDAKVDCTRVVLEAKYSNRAAIQEAKTLWGNCLKELEVVYSRALGENAAVRSSKSATLHRHHLKLMHDLEEQAIREESKGHHNFLSACQAILLHALQPLKESLATSYHILLGWLPSSLHSAPSARILQTGEQPSETVSPRPEPKQSPQPKRQHSSPDPWVSTSMDEASSKASQEGPSSFKRRHSHLVCFSQAQPHGGLQLWLWPHKRSQIMLLFYPSLQLGQ